MNSRAIGARIKHAREGKRLTQEQLAEAVGISATHVSVIERGVKPPRLETFIKIANALSVSADPLLRDVLQASIHLSGAELLEQMKRYLT